ncbi:hypothetical protein Tco_1113471 [Tanacetum coccineum]|uniref:Reverse transcriptase domain-containing protein n=1 Tax=Tanacetum coccineum TaxID=301880 RepID=A0ABQ5IV03_9ASTR
MGLQERTSTFLIRITDDDNDNLDIYATKGGNIIDVDLTTTASLPTGESSSRKTSGPINEPDLGQKLTSKLTGTALGVRIMRQKEEAQEEKTKPSHRVKRDTSLINREGILQAKAGKGQANPLKKPEKETYARGWDQTTHHDTGMQIEKEVSAGSAETPSQRRRDTRELIQSYVTCSRKRQQEIKEEWNTVDRESRMSYTRFKELYDLESDHDLGGHCKSKKHRSNDEDDLSQPWLCDDTDPFTARIQNFEVPKRTRMPVNVKTYDGTGDPDDHLRIFQAAEKIERWAMPTWCHMELLTTKEVHKGSCGNSSHQTEGRRVDGSFHGKIQSGKYACQRSTIVHENIRIHARNHQPRSNKKLNDNIPKSVDEMMSVTTAFLRGEVVAANQSKKKAPPAWKHHETSHRPNFDKRLDFKNQHKSNRRQDRFTPLTKTPKEILAMDTVKFKAPPPMTGPAENRNKNKFCEFHGDKGHSTDECIHLRRQIEEAVKSGQLSHLVKEIKQGGKRGEHAKAAKKAESWAQNGKGHTK